MDIEAIFKAHHNDLVQHLSIKEKNLALVEDLVQDSFIKMHSYLQQGSTIEYPLAWLKKVVTNLWLDHLRVQKKEILPTSFSAGNLDPTEAVHTVHDCLLGIISNLPYKYKKAVYLVDIKGLKQLEAAKQLKMPLPTFKSQVQRGRKLVKEGYVKCCDFTITAKGELQGCVKDWSSCKICSGT